MHTMLAWLISSNSAKTAGAAVTGSGITVAALFGIFDQKMASTMNNLEIRSELKYERVLKDIDHIRESQRDIKETLKVINDRVYELNKKGR